MPTVAELSVTIDAEDNATATIERLNALLDSLERGQTNVDVEAATSGAEDDLRALQAEIDRIDADSISIEVDAQIQQAQAQFAEIQAEINALQNQVNVGVDVDTGAALARVAELRAELAALVDNNQTINIEANADIGGAMAELAALEAALNRIDGRNVEPDTNGLKNLTSAASRASTQVNAIVTAALLLGPVLVPIFAAAAGAAGAFSLALLAAGAGAVLFGGVAISAFSPIAKALTDMDAAQKSYNMATTDKQRDAALEKLKNIYDSLEPAQQKVFDGVTTLRTRWAEFVAIFQPDLFELAARALTDMGNALPALVPLMDSMTRAAGSLLTSLEQSLGSPFWQSFLTTIEQIAGPAMESMVRSIGNIITGIAGMLQAFAPFVPQFVGGFEEMTKKFADWGTGLANNPGFKSFISYMQENIPKVKQFISELWDTLQSIVIAAAPIGSVLLDIFIGVFNALQKLGEVNPNLLMLTILFLGIGAAAVNLIGPILAIIFMFEKIGTAVGALLGPIGLAIAIFAIIAAAVYLAYQNFEPFRNAVDQVWQALVNFAQQVPGMIQTAFGAIVTAVQTAWAWLTSTFGPAISSLVQSVLTEFQKWQDWAQQFAPTFQAAWDNIVGILNTAWQLIQVAFIVGAAVILGLWNALWPLLSTIVVQVWEAIKGVISGAMEIIRGIITVILALIAGDWGAAWQGIVMIFQGAYDIIASLAMALGQILIALFQAAWSLILAGVQAFWSMVQAAFSAAMSFLVSVVTAGWNAIVAVYNATTAACRAIVQAMWTAIQAAFQVALVILIAIGQAIWAGLQEAFNMGKTAILAIWNALWAAVETAVNAAKSLVSSAVQALVEAALNVVSGFTSRFTGAGAALINGLKDGVVSAAQAVYDAVKSVIDKATALLPGSPAKTGPLSGQGWTQIRGQHFVEDLASGMQNRISSIAAVTQDVTDLMTLKLNPEQAFTAITNPAAPVSVTIAANAVQVSVPEGTSVQDASAMVSDASQELANQILTAIRRR